MDLNPYPDDINFSEKSATYIRNSSEQYDLITYDLNDSWTASGYVPGEKKFYIDVLTTAPVGTKIQLQLEKSDAVTPSNFPTGRHSRFEAFTTTQDGWNRLEFEFLDKPDGTVFNSHVDRFVLLFAPNTFSDHTFIWDNLDSYVEGTSSTVEIRVADNEIKIYPNPVGDRLQVHNVGEIHWDRMSVVESSTGKTLLESRVVLGPGASETVNLANLPSGSYVLQLSTGTTLVTQQFIKGK